jgi:uncharacterized membrane protein
MSFIIYVVGFIILIGGLSYGAFLLHVAPRWIVVMDIILVGLAVLTGATRTRMRDPSE